MPRNPTKKEKVLKMFLESPDGVLVRQNMGDNIQNVLKELIERNYIERCQNQKGKYKLKNKNEAQKYYEEIKKYREETDKMFFYRFKDEQNKDEGFQSEARRKSKQCVIIELEDLTLENCEKQLKALQANKTYGDEEGVGEGWLIKEYVKEHPRNSNINEVAAKVAIIDVTNSTNVHLQKKQVNLVKICQTIINNNFDDRISNEERDLQLVDDIAKCGGDRALLLSFASKYCHYHRPMDYMKYDNILCAILPCYLQKYRKATISGNLLKKMRKYEDYIKVIDDLCDNTELKGRKDKYVLLDAFIWYANRTTQEMEQGDGEE